MGLIFESLYVENDGSTNLLASSNIITQFSYGRHFTSLHFTSLQLKVCAAPLFRTLVGKKVTKYIVSHILSYLKI